MKKFMKLMALITALTFCIGTTVFAAEADDKFISSEGGDIDMDGEGDNGDQNEGMQGEEDGEGLDSEAGGTASPQTSASIAPIVAIVGLAAAGTAAGLKRK